MSGYREHKACEGCGGPMERAGYDEWGRFVCGGCVARGSLMAGERRAAESEAGTYALSDDPAQAMQQVRGLIGGVMLLLSITTCTGLGMLMMGMALYQDERLLLGLALGLGGLSIMLAPLAFAVYRARRAKKLGEMPEAPTFRR